jgi:hypothetical protein
LKDVLAVTLPHWCGFPHHHWELADLHLLSCILGNDFVERQKGNGPGTVKSITKEAFQKHPDSHDGRAIFVKEKVSSENSGSFAMAMQMFRHAPAFVISPNEQAVSPRDAFLSCTCIVSGGQRD